MSALNNLVSCNWKEIFTSSNGTSTNFLFSYIPPTSSDVSFSEEELEIGKKECIFTLVGHAIGKRAFYGSLLVEVKRKWSFKGSFKLLTLEGDFFVFKFMCKENYDIVKDHGLCFFNGRPFLFQKWNCNFRPSKSEVKDIPLWIKMPNFPLCCWNVVGISKVASRVGIPLTVDALTTSKSIISFARVCVQITPQFILSESILIDLNMFKFEQKIVYDWNVSSCFKCQTFSHDDKILLIPKNHSSPRSL